MSSAFFCLAFGFWLSIKIIRIHSRLGHWRSKQKPICIFSKNVWFFWSFWFLLRSRVPIDKSTYFSNTCARNKMLAVIPWLTTKIYPLFTGRFYSLWDTGYAKIHIPIITSVSEHQPTTWTSFFFDLHILVCVFPAGVYFCIKEINDERVFSKPNITQTPLFGSILA